MGGIDQSGHQKHKWTRLELAGSGSCGAMEVTCGSRFAVRCGLGATVWSVEDVGGMTALRDRKSVV